MERHYESFNANRDGRNVGDCTVRAICTALDEGWERVYVGLCLKGFEMADMPSSNAVWGAYLRGRGFTRHVLPNECPDCYTLEDFCADHPSGVYLVAMQTHVVCVRDGKYYDTWDSGGAVPVYYWERND